MARLARDLNRTKPWKAEVKVLYKARFLGYFHTKEEAETAEAEFRKTHPDGRKEPLRVAS